jgi:hypothetical protein
MIVGRKIILGSFVTKENGWWAEKMSLKVEI